MEFTPEAQNRIAVCKCIVDKLKELAGRTGEDWHVFTFRKDRKCVDPCRFRVHNTKMKSFRMMGSAVVPREFLFSIVFNNEDRELILSINTRELDVSSLSIGEISPVLPSSIKKLDVVYP